MIEAFRAARRDPQLAVLEGFHALKHAVRFGAEVERAVAADAAAVRALAARPSGSGPGVARVRFPLRGPGMTILREADPVSTTPTCSGRGRSWPPGCYALTAGPAPAHGRTRLPAHGVADEG